MNSIQNFQEVRRDGKLIDESMTGLDMIRAGWTPDKIVTLRWLCSNRAIELHSQFGFLSRVVGSRQYLAVMEDTDATGQFTRLTIYQADGTPCETLENRVPIAGKPEAGIFASFRSPKIEPSAHFKVLFDVLRNGGRYEVEIDVLTGEILSANETR